uniref:Uncharacterized protein n=1 Tax=Sphaerodactylus townsendi TaxID=933632 RepID=A0ACB8FKS7_9SAUR
MPPKQLCTQMFPIQLVLNFRLLRCCPSFQARNNGDCRPPQKGLEPAGKMTTAQNSLGKAGAACLKSFCVISTSPCFFFLTGSLQALVLYGQPAWMDQSSFSRCCPKNDIYIIAIKEMHSAEMV